MIELFRITQTRYSSDLTGEGARLFGARWNHVGIPCIYTAENRALSLCELFCSIGNQALIPHLSLITYTLDSTKTKTILIDELPTNWNDLKHPEETKDLGSKLLQSNQFVMIKVPSVIIPEEYNCIINIFHPDFKTLKIKQIRPFSFDERFRN